MEKCVKFKMTFTNDPKFVIKEEIDFSNTNLYISYKNNIVEMRILRTL